MDVDCFILGLSTLLILTLPVVNFGWYEHENSDSRLSLPYLAEGKIEDGDPSMKQVRLVDFQDFSSSGKVPGIGVARVGAGRRISRL